jgi:integral membrane protein
VKRAITLVGSPVARLRVVGMLEGISFLALLGIAMPIKYLAGMPGPVLVVGWAHGVLFVVYLAAVAHAALAGRWSPPKIFAALAASVLPFGPFVFDAWYLKEAPATRAPLGSD